MISKSKIQLVKVGQHTCFALGNTDLLNRKSIAVAGSRQIDSESTSWLQQAIADLPSNWVVTSGLALGCDAIAHKSALDNNLKTIAVLPSGIGNITPKTNIPIAKEIIKNDGLLLSEYPYKQGIRSNKQYIDRNKIIVDISESLLVPQFNTKSGTRHTVDFARNQNKVIIIQNKNYSGNQYILSNNSYHTFIR